MMHRPTCKSSCFLDDSRTSAARLVSASASIHPRGQIGRLYSTVHQYPGTTQRCQPASFTLTREPVLSGRGWDHLVMFSDYPLINLGFRRLCKAKLASTKTGPQREFTLTESKTYSGGLIALKYRRVRGKAAVEAKSTSKSKRKRYELAGLRERLPGANRRSRSTDTYLDGYGVLPGTAVLRNLFLDFTPLGRQTLAHGRSDGCLSPPLRGCRD
jgi:hypothetical protein